MKATCCEVGIFNAWQVSPSLIVSKHDKVTALWALKFPSFLRQVDFTSMIMIKPNKRSIQRTYHDGLWLQLRKSAHQFQFHIKVNRLQVDNQTPAAIFPTVLSPVPLPKTVAAESGRLYPFILCSFLGSIYELVHNLLSSCYHSIHTIFNRSHCSIHQLSLNCEQYYPTGAFDLVSCIIVIVAIFIAWFLSVYVIC